MAFDGIVTKAIASELNMLSGARIDKIFQPNLNNVIIGMYLNGINYALNISIDSSNYRINLTTHSKPNPKIAPNFCMVLRKHLIGLHIKNIITNNLERVITIEFEGFNDIDDLISKKIVIELMGRHCNIVLLDSGNTIIDSLRHINSENANRIIVPHIKYIYPKTDKKNFLDCIDFETFIESLKTENVSNSLNISNSFNGISKKYISFIENEINSSNLEDIYNYLKNVINNTDSLNLEFKNIDNDYFLVPSSNSKPFSLNFFIDDFYYTKESMQELKNYKDTVLKLILSTFEKYKKRLKNMDSKLRDCDNIEKYKLYGELITANLYRIPNNNINEITLENYYDNNKVITIELDERYSPSINAKRFYKKYNKLKNTLEIVSKQKEETINELAYLESIIYELNTANTIEDISEILDELSDNDMFKDKIENIMNKNKKLNIKKSNLTKNKTVSFNPLKYKINDFTLLVGRNNKENDYLTSKYAKKTDIWFHTKDIHGSHGVLILNNKTPNQDILTKCAEIVAYHSKAKLSSNVPVDYCEVKFVKKPKGSKPGMVIYTNNSTLYVNPKN